MKLKKWQIIEIDWLDSVHDNGWKFEDTAMERAQDKFLKHKTIGYFLKETKQFIAVVQSKSNDGEDKSNVDAVMQIPKAVIKKIKRY